MIFHEKLNLTFDVAAMREELTNVQNVGERYGIGDDAVFGGWSLQSQDGDWRSGFEKGGYYETEDGLKSAEQALAPHLYEHRTKACTGIFGDIIDELTDKGFYPCRSRITVLTPGQVTLWHTDAQEGNYSVRIHIPIITNADCGFGVRDEGSVHMPADGHAYLVDASTTHRAYNRGTEMRYHFLAQVWPTQYSEHFHVTESRKNIMSFHNMKGYEIYKQVMSDKAKG